MILVSDIICSTGKTVVFRMEDNVGVACLFPLRILFFLEVMRGNPRTIASKNKHLIQPKAVSVLKR
jgi:hypothetical protein